MRKTACPMPGRAAPENRLFDYVQQQPHILLIEHVVAGHIAPVPDHEEELDRCRLPDAEFAAQIIRQPSQPNGLELRLAAQIHRGAGRHFLPVGHGLAAGVPEFDRHAGIGHEPILELAGRQSLRHEPVFESVNSHVCRLSQNQSRIA